MSWDGAFSYFDFFSIPKNAPHAENALKLISFRLDPQVGAKLAEEIGYPVPSPLVYEAADKTKRRYWANNPEVQTKMVEWSASYWGGAAEGGRTNEEVNQEKLNALLAK
jgi:putative spermidine/putrescine transport system substrate-binding protein